MLATQCVHPATQVLTAVKSHQRPTHTPQTASRSSSKEARIEKPQSELDDTILGRRTRIIVKTVCGTQPSRPVRGNGPN